jgi:glycosyltransferase involved in cell wall biosynthesis
VPRAERSRPLVVHVMEAFAGGTERHLIDLVRHVDGVDHVIAVPRRHHGRSTAAAAREAERAGARVQWLETDRSRRMHRNLAATVALHRLLERLRPDLVHGHSSIGGAVARLAAARSSVPVLYTPNGLARTGWAQLIERGFGRLTDRLIAVSGSEARVVRDRRIVTPERIVVIPNGIDLTLPSPLDPPLRIRLGLDEQTPLVGCVGRLARQKAPEIYVRACALVAQRHPAAHFVLIGSGPLLGTVRAEIVAARIDRRFHLVEVLPGAAAALAELDVYVLPSRFEGGPYTPLEAMRAGTPVIVTDADGNRDEVTDGISGLVVPLDDPPATAAAIDRLLADPGLATRLTAGAAAALPRFDVREMGRATGAVYRELLTTAR